MNEITGEIKLDKYQKEVVYYSGDKPMSVEAGPGAGKTRVIIERVKYLLKEKRIDPRSLLVITFTRKAADELKERLADSDIPKSDIDLMQISTIHGFCSKILTDKGTIGFDVIDDDLNEKTNMFIGKYLKDLGFENEFTVKSRDIRDIVRKYNEYTTFNVNTKKLIEYIKKERPMTQEYVDFVKNYMENNDGKFPFDEIYENKDLKKSYYNAKYLRIAESYPKYLQLLEEKNYVDFSLMQVKTLELLQKDPNTQFTNVLIDEFQDTDPVQMEIFKILMENADSFVVVGDIDQSIYGFRGALNNYFYELYESHGDNIERKNLPINYRSTDEIIKFSEDYIKHQRSNYTSKDKAIGNRNVQRDMYYMVSDNNKSEAQQILDAIMHLKNNDKIKNYNDIGILVRSVKSKKNCIAPLIKILEEEGIPYQIKGLDDLLDKPEIKSILTLMAYIIKDENDKPHIFNGWELEWLNLKAFTGENFPQVLVNLSDETKEILNNAQDEFKANVQDLEKIVYKNMTGKTSRLNKFHRLFKASQSRSKEFINELLIEIFSQIELPLPTLDNLRKWGVKNEDDLRFFYLLNDIRDRVLDEDMGYKERPTTLKLFLELLSITDYADEEFLKNDDNRSYVENIAILSNTLYNFEQIRNPKDFRGVFWFLYHNINEYSSYAAADGVQIMTVHKAKGLEFPVVIVGSLSEGQFPSSFKDPNPESGYAFINGKNRPVYYTPNECLEYKKDITIEKEEILHDEEEERIIYVALTRAKDTLILSTLSDSGAEDILDSAMQCQSETFSHVPKGSGKIEYIINRNDDICVPLRYNYNIIEPMECEMSEDKKERIELSFTSIENYLNCPFRYKLENDLGIKASDINPDVKRGIFIHKSFEVINKKILNNGNIYIGDEEVEEIVTNLYYKSTLRKIEEDYEDKTLEKFIEDILYYYNYIGNKFEIIDVEVPFYIKKEAYVLKGVIDLIYKKPDGTLGILDYKNTKYLNKELKRYIKQLYTYILGLADEDHKYKNYLIEELCLYAVRSRELKEIPIIDEEIIKLSEDIDTTALNIERKKFASKKDKHCMKCQYSEICKGKSNKLEGVILPTNNTNDEFKFCTRCGEKLGIDDIFCSKCGHKQQ